jgi:hypothetical protein
MSVSSTEHLDKLAFILYDRPSGRNIIGYAIEKIEQLRADLATKQGCCDGAAAQDAHIRREREEHRAQIERLRAEMQSAKADAWDEGEESAFVWGSAKANPYRGKRKK